MPGRSQWTSQYLKLDFPRTGREFGCLVKAAPLDFLAQNAERTGGK